MKIGMTAVSTNGVGTKSLATAKPLTANKKRRVSAPAFIPSHERTAVAGMVKYRVPFRVQQNRRGCTQRYLLEVVAQVLEDKEAEIRALRALLPGKVIQMPTPGQPLPMAVRRAA